jgi:hypothetical protein
MRDAKTLVLSGIVLVGVVAQAAEPQPMYVSPGVPASECVTQVNYGADAKLPGYLVQDPGGKVCVPFTYPARFVPSGYKGDYYVDEFTDAKIKAKYRACKQDRACDERLASIAQQAPVPHEFRVTGSVDPTGKIDPHGAVDLKQIRRPSYFGKAPYREPIGEAEARTYTVEFLVPREAYERLHMKRTGSVALRGWYLEGAGVPDEHGSRMRALIVLVGGRSIETTAMQATDELLYDYDKTTGKYVARTFPNATSEKWALRGWRYYLYELNRAGFDVFTFDKRGHGISGGYNDNNTLEQGRDMWRALDALESGEGVRAVTPSGQLIEGAAIRGRFLAGMKAKQVPVIFGGPSQGSMATSWAMHQNFVQDCTYDLAEVRCSPAHRYNVKGALVMAGFEGGIGARAAPNDVENGALIEARSRIENNIVMMPSSEPLANIDKWPAVFFGRGLWDFGESLEGTLASYRRVKGLKEIVVVRGPHGENEFGEENVKHMAARMAAFSKAAVLGQREVAGAAKFVDLKSLVASSIPFWEPSSDPARIKQREQGLMLASSNFREFIE